MSEQIHAPGLLQPTAQPLSCAVTVHGRNVVQHFNQPREYVAYTGLESAHIGAKLLANTVAADGTTGQHVLDLCMAIMDSVYEERGDLKPAGGAVKHELIERHRRTLTKRLEVVLNSTREKKTTSNHQLAKELVEICLKEVFA